MSRADSAYIVGIYEHPTRKAENTTTAQLHADVARGALEDAGLSLADVDGFFCGSDAPGMGAMTMSEYIGLSQLRYIDSTETGGSSYVLHLQHAVQAIAAGKLCFVGSLRFFPQIKRTGDDRFDVTSWLLLSGVLAAVIVLLDGVRDGHADSFIWFVPMVLLALAYLYRSKRVREPMLDFSLLRVPTFAASFWSGSLLRVGYGALPFLLPLMLQLGLGYSPIQSGMVLLASGAIALVTKTQTTRMLRRWGFRTVMLVNGSLCVLALACCALFRANWDIAAIAIAVSIAGFFRAVQFNAVTAIAYAELPAQRIGAATTLNTMVQQLAIMLGIALSSAVIAFSARWEGRAELAPMDFSVAFIAVALFGALATPACLRLRKDAGSQLSGHRI